MSPVPERIPKRLIRDHLLNTLEQVLFCLRGSTALIFHDLGNRGAEHRDGSVRCLDRNTPDAFAIRLNDVSGYTRDLLEVANVLRGPPHHRMQPVPVLRFDLDNQGVILTTHTLKHCDLLDDAALRGLAKDAHWVGTGDPEVGDAATT